MVVIGVGNILLCDEGVGVHVVNALEEKTDLPGVRFIDGGVAGFTLINLIEGNDKVVVIDAVSAPLSPGTVIELLPHELRVPGEKKLSLHDYNLTDTIEIMRLRETLPSMVIFGIVPEDRDSFKIGLSSTLSDKFDEIVGKIHSRIEELLLK